MTPTAQMKLDPVRRFLVDAFLYASNVEAMELIFKAQQEVFIASVLNPESSIQGSQA